LGLSLGRNVLKTVISDDGSIRLRLYQTPVLSDSGSIMHRFYQAPVLSDMVTFIKTA